MKDANPNDIARLVKVGVIQLKGFSLDVAKRFMDEAAEDKPDVVLLPEIGCGREPEPISNSPIIETMREYAKRGKMYVIINFFEADGEDTFNTTVILARDGEIAGVYRKVHIPLPTEKNYNQQGGDELSVFNLDFAQVGIEVCFDNYFPETVRSMALQGAEIIFFPHQEHYCWNGVEHVEILARARAIENVIFVVLAGPTAAEDCPFGRTGIIDPTGKYILTTPNDKECYASTEIDINLIHRIMVDDTDVPMRTQMLVDKSVRELYGRRQPDVYRKYLDSKGESYKKVKATNRNIQNRNVQNTKG